MPSTRNERRVAATKQNIMGGFQEENSPKEISVNYSVVSEDLDGTSSDQVRLLLEDLDLHLKRRQGIMTAESETGKQEQQQVHFSGMVKLSSKIKKMSVRDFNSQHNCNLLQMLKDVASYSTLGKKRVLMDMETPAPKKGRKAMKTPSTMSRNIRKGESVYSTNGSPLEQTDAEPTDEGALIATVTKKRRGTTRSSGVDFAINVGDGRKINLGDACNVQSLDDEMKSSAMVQLKVLQDQMASLMAQLTN